MQSAVEALAIIGDKQAKSALFERLQQWRAGWMGRQQERSSWRVGDGPIEDDRYLGAELVQTIATGAGWLLTSEEQQRLTVGALTENEKQQAAQIRSTGEGQTGPSSGDQHYVAQFSGCCGPIQL